MTHEIATLPPPTNEAERIQVLTLLAREIRGHADTVEAKAFEARKPAMEAILSAQLAGQALERAQAMIERGTWNEWLKTHCPKVSYETARRWIRLANLSGVTDWNDCKSLTDAYIKAGILPAPKMVTAGTEAEAQQFDLTKFARWAGSFNKRISPDICAQLSQDERNALLATLEPVIQFHKLLTQPEKPAIEV